MEENKKSIQIVPLNVDYSSKKEGKSNMILMKLRKGKMEWVFYDSLDKEQKIDIGCLPSKNHIIKVKYIVHLCFIW